MVRERLSARLEPWLAAVARSDIGSLKRFANGLRQDRDLVLACPG
jgi:hypothetical protein